MREQMFYVHSEGRSNELVYINVQLKTQGAFEPCASNDILRRSKLLYSMGFTPPIISSQNVLNGYGLEKLVLRCYQELEHLPVPQVYVTRTDHSRSGVPDVGYSPHDLLFLYF